MVDVSQNRRTRPKIRSHAKDVARKLALDRITRLSVRGDVGATKAINRLLWIADHKQATRQQWAIMPTSGRIP